MHSETEQRRRIVALYLYVHEAGTVLKQQSERFALALQCAHLMGVLQKWPHRFLQTGHDTAQPALKLRIAAHHGVTLSHFSDRLCACAAAVAAVMHSVSTCVSWVC